MPRVALIHCGFTYSGGGERLVLEEALGLRSRGFEVDCYAPVIDPSSCFPEIIERVRPKPLFPQLPRWFPLRDALQMAVSSLFAPLLASTLPRYDLIIGANQPSAWIAWVVSKLRRRPYIAYLNQPNRLVYPRDVDIETGWQTKRDYQILNKLIQAFRGFVKWADWVSIRDAEVLLVDGLFIGSRISEIYQREVVDCPAGCHILEDLGQTSSPTEELTIDGIRIRRPYVLLTNRHYPQKRFEFAIHAMTHVGGQHSNIPLVITGAFTGYTSQLRLLCEELGATDRVLFVGEVSEEDLDLLYREASVYVYPSPEEDFGMGVVEAMARSLPVVAWRHGGPTVTVEDGETGYLVTPYSVEEFAAAIRILLDEPHLAAKMGGAGRRRARDHFSWHHHLDVLLSAAEAAMTRPGRGGAPEARIPSEEPRRKHYTAVWEKRRLISSLPDMGFALDVGAGNGEYVSYLLERSDIVVAVDTDPVRIDELRRRFSHVANVHVVQGSLSALPFRNGSFDLVWASEVIEHLPGWDSLDEMERVGRRMILATLPSPTGPYLYLDRSHLLRYSITEVERWIADRPGWSYTLEGFGLCFPQWMGLDWLRDRWLRLSRRRPWAAWTLLLWGKRMPRRLEGP